MTPMNERFREWLSDGEIAGAVGARLRALREERGLSQRALAERLLASNSLIAKYEAGVHTPPLPALVRLAAIFDVSLDHLVGRAAELTPLRDPRLIRCMREIAAMEESSRELVTMAIEGMVSAYQTLRHRRRAPRAAGAPPKSS
jgi:transcriptional regulator with XRE-family HTH domain